MTACTVISNFSMSSKQLINLIVQLVYGKWNNQLIYLMSDGSDLKHYYILLCGNLNKQMLFRHIHSDGNPHNLPLNENLLMENLMLRD